MTLGRRNLDELIRAVGSKLDIQISSNTVPSKDDVTEWLQDGFLRMLMYLPGPMLTEVSVVQGFENVDVGADALFEWDLGTDVVRILGATTENYTDTDVFAPAIVVPYSEYRAIKALVDGSASVVQSYISVTPGGAKVVSWPKLRRNIELEYVPRPASAYDWPTAAGSPPLEWEPAVIDYAVAQGRMQDEEPALGQASMADWEKRMAEMARTGVYAVDDGA